MPQPLTIQNFSLHELPGIPADILTALKARQIETTLGLLKAAPSLDQRRTLARSLDLRDQVIGKWFAMADLARLPAVGTQYCGLLLHCGIHSVTQLAIADAGRLHRHVLRFHVALLRQKNRCPELVDVMQWIQQAKLLSRAQSSKKPRQ